MSYSPFITQLIDRIGTMPTPADQLAYVRNMTMLYSGNHVINEALYTRLQELLQNQPQTTSPLNLIDHVQQDGTIYDLSQWVTLVEYAKLYDLKSTNIINNWISRGIVPPDCIVELRHLNQLKLIRSKPYKTIST